MQHELTDNCVTVTSDGIVAACICGWTSGARITSLSASALFLDHQQAMTADPKSQLQPNDLVQLSPETCENPVFAGCIMVVTEVRGWGAIGYVREILPGGLAYYRAKWDEMQRVGRTYWVLGHKD